MAQSQIFSHGCVNEGQDRLHGKGQRVFNPTKASGSDKDQGWRCTVCAQLRK